MIVEKSGALDFFKKKIKNERKNGISQLRSPNHRARFQRIILASTARIVSNDRGADKGIVVMVDLKSWEEQLRWLIEFSELVMER
jgi:hypothetical protein